MSEQIIQSFNGKAGADLSSYQNRFVYISGVKTIGLCTTEGMKADAVLQDEPSAAGTGCKLAASGIVFVLSGEAVTAGTEVTNDTTGRAIVAGAGQPVHGKAWTTCTGADEYIVVKLSLAGALKYGVEYAAPSNLETAAFGAAVVNVWEDYDLIAAINTAAVGAIATGQRVALRGVLEIVNADGAAARNFRYADGETPDNDDTVVSVEVPLASSTPVEVELFTDASGQIKIESDDQADLTAIFHIKSFRYVHPTAFV
jgi:hypothetical protein